jgi:hypothetical protein
LQRGVMLSIPVAIVTVVDPASEKRMQ